MDGKRWGEGRKKKMHCCFLVALLVFVVYVISWESSFKDLITLENWRKSMEDEKKMERKDGENRRETYAKLKEKEWDDREK